MSTRIERDSMGEVEVASDRYWGAQTERSRRNFPIGTERMPTALIHGYALLKAEAARTNAELGLLDENLARQIITAAERVAGGELDAHFPLSIWQTGSGTQTNMNVNEVIANLVSAATGEPLGSKQPAHPNDHVNMGQSSNDSFPTAMQLAAAGRIQGALLPALQTLTDTLAEKQRAFSHIVKLGRTHLQDATPLTVGQEFSGWMAQLRAARAAVEATLPALCSLPLGGTAVGTGIGTDPEFAKKTVARLAARLQLPLTVAENRFATIAAHDACAFTSGALKTVAIALMKIASDVRLLASGPRTGLGELLLPENEPGSSIMPGKVNPTQCEALTMVACQVMGNDATLSFACSQGQLQLNVYKPVIAHNLLQSIELLSDACRSFEERCVRGIEVNRDRVAQHVERSLMLVTALSPSLGYDAAARIAHHALQHDQSLKEAALALYGLQEERFDALVDPLAMTQPGR